LRDQIIFHLGIKCGLRRSEVINLDWEHVNFETGKIKIVNSKGGKDRFVFISNDLKGKMLEYRKGTGFYKGPVIRGKCRKRMTKASLQNLIKRIYREAGIYREGLCFHSLRHTYAEILRKNNTDTLTISMLLGHSNLNTTQQYLHSNEEDLIKASIA
jgi:integrase/recombinase XerD